MLFYILEAQVERHAGVRSERYLVNMQRRFQILQVTEDARLASAVNLQNNSCQKFRKNNIVYAAPTDIKIDFTFMISYVKSYALKYMILGNFFSQANLQVKTRQRHLSYFSFWTSVTFFSGPGPTAQCKSQSQPQHGRPWLPEHHLESFSDLSLPVRQA